MTALTEFLLARIAEDEAIAENTGGSLKRWTKEPYPGHPDAGWRMRYPASAHISDWSDGVGSGYFAVTEHCERHDPARVLAECEAKRHIVEWHRNWPVLAETPLEVERVDSTDPTSFAFRASQRIAWLTEREYVARFGCDPPAGPVLRLLALPYADHPDYDEEWKP